MAGPHEVRLCSPHDLVLAFFLQFLAHHHRLDDAPFLGGEVRQVGQVCHGRRRRLRGAAAMPPHSRRGPPSCWHHRTTGRLESRPDATLRDAARRNATIRKRTHCYVGLVSEGAPPRGENRRCGAVIARAWIRQLRLPWCSLLSAVAPPFPSRPFPAPCLPRRGGGGAERGACHYCRRIFLLRSQLDDSGSTSSRSRVP